MGLWDAYPVTPGHALLIPTRHVNTWFDATTEERVALLRGIDAARTAIDTGFGAEGYNIGVNTTAALVWRGRWQTWNEASSQLAPGGFELGIEAVR